MAAVSSRDEGAELRLTVPEGGKRLPDRSVIGVPLDLLLERSTTRGAIRAVGGDHLRPGEAHGKRERAHDPSVSRPLGSIQNENLKEVECLASSWSMTSRSSV
jgi:hypothetical protein